jgi:hypothetical protein
MYFTGIIIALGTFLIIGVFHPIVIKTEYHFGTRPWWLFLVGGIAAICGSLAISNTVVSALVGVVGASLLWSIGEIFAQKKRVEKGWFPMNPKRRDQYTMVVQGPQTERDAASEVGQKGLMPELDAAEAAGQRLQEELDVIAAARQEGLQEAPEAPASQSARP